MLLSLLRGGLDLLELGADIRCSPNFGQHTTGQIELSLPGKIPWGFWEI